MALDLYAGPLTRYYVKNWENRAQRMARENGIAYVIAQPDECKTPDPVRDPTIIRDTVVAWRSIASHGLGDHLECPLDWPESNEAEYFTDRLYWEGRCALILQAAYLEHPQIEPPIRVPDTWDDDPAFLASTASEFSSVFGQILLPELWLPGEFSFTFETESMPGPSMWMGSTVALAKQLHLLNERVFRGSADDLEAWRTGPPSEEKEFAATARFGMALVLDVVEKAVEANVPMLLDY